MYCRPVYPYDFGVFCTLFFFLNTTIHQTVKKIRWKFFSKLVLFRSAADPTFPSEEDKMASSSSCSNAKRPAPSGSSASAGVKKMKRIHCEPEYLEKYSDVPRIGAST